MSFFRRSSDPSAREAFLLVALAAVGMTADNVDAAMAAKETGFLEAFTVPQNDLDAARNSAKEATDRATKLAAERDGLVSCLTSAGYKAEEFSSPAAFKQAHDERVSRAAVELSASRGITPVTQTAFDAGNTKTITKAQFDAMSHEERNKHFASGGKITD